MTTQNDDMTETVVNAGDTVKTDDIELEAPKNAMATARRLFVQLGNQRVRLCVVAASILLFTFFHIAAPMYSAVVVDSIWDAVQGAWRDGVPFSVSWNAGGIGWDDPDSGNPVSRRVGLLLPAVLSDGVRGRKPQPDAAQADQREDPAASAALLRPQ